MMIGVSVLLFCFGSQIYSVESLAITANVNGTWTEDSSVTLTCNISPYAGQMQWLRDSTDVAQCNPSTCYQSVDEEGSFSFGFDTIKHIFTWTINPVKLSYNGSVFKCSDGSKTTSITAVVQEKQDDTTQTNAVTEPSTPAQVHINTALVSVSVTGVICIIVIYIKRKVNKKKWDSEREGQDLTNEMQALQDKTENNENNEAGMMNKQLGTMRQELQIEDKDNGINKQPNTMNDTLLQKSVLAESTESRKALT